VGACFFVCVRVVERELAEEENCRPTKVACRRG
jgi:hypothetical protein